jgi:hypothetical protein
MFATARDTDRIRIRRHRGIGHGFRALDHVQSQVERVPAEDVAHVLAADDDHLRPTSSATPFRPAGLISRTIRWRTGRRQSERFAGVHAGTEVRHQMAERSRLPLFIERLRLSDTQSAAGVIWSVSIASRFFVPGGAAGSQKISARPRMRGGADAGDRAGEASGT